MIPGIRFPFAAQVLPAAARRLALILVLLAAPVLGSGNAARAEVLIGPGDTIRLTIQGLPNSEVDSTVGIDGFLPLAWPGRVQAAGRTLDEVLAEVRQMAEGRVYKRYTPEGLLKLFQLAEEDLSLSVVAYRPVAVSGDVARPSEVTFRPGLTARSAIAVAGGVRSSLLADLSVTDPGQIVRWQNDYARAALDHATALARHWRVNAEINDVANPEPLDPALVAVTREVLGALTNEQLQLIDVRRKSEEGDRAYLQSVLEQARNRVRILTEQRANQSEQVAADEEEEARVRDLVDRSLVPATRLNDVRRNTVLSAARLLDLESQLAAANLDVTRGQRDIEAYEETRLTDLLTLREQLNATVIEARLRMDQLTQNLAGSSEGDSMASQLMSMNATVRVFRKVDGRITPMLVDIDSELEPGDTLEVMLDQPVDIAPGQ
jgi:polysaccharide export outer membrane protein